MFLYEFWILTFEVWKRVQFIFYILGIYKKSDQNIQA